MSVRKLQLYQSLINWAIFKVKDSMQILTFMHIEIFLPQYAWRRTSCDMKFFNLANTQLRKLVVAVVPY